MDIDLGYQSLDSESAIAQPTADFVEEARRKYIAGEISQGELAAWVSRGEQIESSTAAAIAADRKEIAERYSYANLYGRPLLAAGGAIADTIKNVLALGLVVLAIYLLTSVKQLEKS